MGIRRLVRRPSRRTSIVVLVLALTGALSVVANAPVTTNVMVDFVPDTVTQPFYAKAIAFLDRDIQMRQLAGRIVGDATVAEDKADRIMRWTAAHIRPTPRGMPIVDDHPYNIVIRGYGEPDQAADVFANLAGYVGMPGGVVFSRARDGSALYAFALIEIDGAGRVFDVRETRALRNGGGELATIEELRREPAGLDRLPAPAAAHGTSYRTLIEGLDSAPHRLGSDQMTLSRLLSEISRLLRRDRG